VASRAEWDKTRSCHIYKYERLHNKEGHKKDYKPEFTQNEAENIRARWVKNISSRQLSEYELKILQKGLNYAITPDKLPVNEFTAIETACKYIGANTDEATSLRNSCVNIIKNAKLPKSNISMGERKAIKELKHDKCLTRTAGGSKEESERPYI